MLILKTIFEYTLNSKALYLFMHFKEVPKKSHFKEIQLALAGEFKALKDLLLEISGWKLIYRRF